MHHFRLQQVSEHLALAAVIAGAFVLLSGRSSGGLNLRWATPLLVASVLALAVAPMCYSGLFEKLILGPERERGGRSRMWWRTATA